MKTEDKYQRIGVGDFHSRRKAIIDEKERLLKKISEDIYNNGGSPVVERNGAISLINGNENTFDELFPITEEEDREIKRNANLGLKL
ncbi:MAG: hypothetical protein WD398_10520 [Cyclobacteriaceae bacterium]